MDKGQRKRRAATAALALLEWRDRMRRENADREEIERETTMRYELMLAEMLRQADKFVAPREARLRTEPTTSAGLPACHGTGHAGAI